MQGRIVKGIAGFYYIAAEDLASKMLQLVF